ncbi:hypothetical protein [Natrarchaeobius chitinivorans]|uniref:hypothetical protein n=1 Tax=Natrarchaeobius chitinivorans TaxID=1679083 RepID=UPI001FB46A9A|nr:hypothetical protein [Natrarchaeobius chitinivorans]
MGRTNPTYRDAIRRMEAEWEPMRRALRRTYQTDFDRLFDRSREFADAAGYANPASPERALVLSLLLAHEIELRRLREEREGRRESEPRFERGDDEQGEATREEKQDSEDDDRTGEDGER